MARERLAVLTATLAAGAMIAHQVGAKATRDALYLSRFEVTTLPVMIMGAAAVSVVVALLATRLLSRVGPGAVVGTGFLISTTLHLGEWALAPFRPGLVGILLYLHTAVFGLVLVSGFWSLITERFDPRTAKRHMGRLGAGATLGGLAGGLLAERVGTLLGVTAMLGVLAALHLTSAVLVRRFRIAMPSPRGTSAGPSVGPWEGFRVLREVPYLRHLAFLVVLTAVGAGLLDYVFKVAATETWSDGERLIRFFALFYTGLGVVTFLIQSVFTRPVLESGGLGRAVAALPAWMAGGSLLALAVPGLAILSLVRGGESVLKSSLFRSGYELHYTPIPPEKKRATKTIIDVGCDRLGDAIGAGLVQLVLLSGTLLLRPVLFLLAAGLGLAGLGLIRRLQRGYITALEESLRDRAVHLDLESVGDSTTRSTMLQTLSGIRREPSWTPEPVAVPPTGEEAPPADPRTRRLRILQSADAERIRRELAEGEPDPTLVPELVRLLAWDAVAESVLEALVRTGPGIIEPLAERLLDPDEDFAIRRRIPRALARFETGAAAAALVGGLEDIRFEVRFQCSRALARLASRQVAAPITPEAIHERILKEAGVGRKIWEGRRLLETRTEARDSVFVDEVLRDRADRSLEHVFTLLSLILPREPLGIAFRGLHTQDRTLRGTALEYLETVLPPRVRERLWPLLERSPGPSRAPRPSEAVLRDLLRSRDSIRIQLERGAPPDSGS